jgi:hypothetical protein
MRTTARKAPETAVNAKTGGTPPLCDHEAGEGRACGASHVDVDADDGGRVGVMNEQPLRPNGLRP